MNYVLCKKEPLRICFTLYKPCDWVSMRWWLYDTGWQRWQLAMAGAGTVAFVLHWLSAIATISSSDGGLRGSRHFTIAREITAVFVYANVQSLHSSLRPFAFVLDWRLFFFSGDCGQPNGSHSVQVISAADKLYRWCRALAGEHNCSWRTSYVQRRLITRVGSFFWTLSGKQAHFRSLVFVEWRP